MDKKLSKLNLGQFIFLYFVGRNTDYNVFKCILENLAKEDLNIRKQELKGLLSIPNDNAPPSYHDSLTLPSANRFTGSVFEVWTKLNLQSLTKKIKILDCPEMFLFLT